MIKNSLFPIVSVLSGCGGSQNSYTANNKEYVLGVSGPLTCGAAMYGQAVTDDSISWDSAGYVNKTAIQYVIKEAN